MENIFDSLVQRKNVKRTYSMRGVLEECSVNETGLATPPPSSSPTSSPIAVHIAPTTIPSIKHSAVRSSEALFGQHARTKRLNTGKKQAPKPAGRELVQMHLNLLPARVTCKECGMSYTKTSPHDTNLHIEFHKTHLYGMAIPSTISSSRQSHNKQNVKDAGIETIRLAAAKTAEKAVLKRMCRMVDLELNSTLPELNDNYTAYFCTFNGRCIAFLLVQPVSQSHPVLDNGELDVTQPKPCVFGVSRMWTCKSYRKQGLMRRLLEHARNRFVYGSTCTAEEICFTQLSESGQAFLAHYMPGLPVLMYTD